MAAIPLSFYLFQPGARDHGLASMLQKHLARDKRALVLVDDDAAAKTIDDFLWQYSQDEFLPHGIIQQGDNHDLQPILIVPLQNNRELQNLNRASAVFFIPNQIDDITTILKNASQSATHHAIEQWVFLFSQHDQHHESIMAKIFALVSGDAKNFTLTQWQQTAKGTWLAARP